MTRISTNLGGAAPASGERSGVAPGGQPDRWREQYQAYVKGGADVDWDAPENASPQPSPKTHFGRRAQVKTDVPELPITNVRVRSKPPRTYYDGDGRPIPANWSLVPLTADILDAVRNGDLEQDKSYKDLSPYQQAQQAAQQPPAQPSRRHREQPPAE